MSTRPRSSKDSRSTGSLAEARANAKTCKACELWKLGTQTVFGEGDTRAKIMIVGEQPGDQEDLQGRPFVGPAGKLLNASLEKAGLDRSELYVTNAVKHFKYELRGKRRLHKSPAQREILACNPWVRIELESVNPTLVIALGATAARALFGKAIAVMANRGRVQETEERRSALVTVHPSYLLRVPPEDRDRAIADFVKDLKTAASFAAARKVRAAER